MFVICAFFSAIVIGVTRSTSARVEANQQIAFERAVLSVLPGGLEKNMPNSAVHEKFNQQITKPSAQTAGAYVLKQRGIVKGYALPIKGQGFWAPIKGIIGLKPDKKTITGIAFYEQNETPGLGARITEPEFKSQFAGLETAPEGKPISMKRQGDPLQASQIYAITGATQTSVRLEKIINDELVQWKNDFDKENDNTEN
jgi:Na+-transporting NADH:ubiquinone oxidoreductase subunit C